MTEQLRLLAVEMRTGVLALAPGPHEQVVADLDRVAAAVAHTSNPDVSLVTSLFRKYADVTHEMKEEYQQKLNRLGFIADLPPLYEVEDDKQLVGWAALKTNAFWVRIATAFFHLIAFSLLIATGMVNYARYNPSWDFLPNCPVFQGKYFHGYFEMWPFQSLVALSVVTNVYSTIIAGFYCLPVDEDNDKVIPGCLARHVPTSESRSPPSLRWLKVKVFSRAIHAAIDMSLALMTLVFAFIASSYLQSSVPFSTKYYAVPLRFSISSFYGTYCATEPACVKFNPTMPLAVALGFFYVAVVAQFLCFQMSFSAYKHEVRQHQLSSQLGGMLELRSHGSVLAEMHHLPLRVQEDDDGVFDSVEV